MALAHEFRDLTCEFDEYLPEEWTNKLVGADPGAGGRKNRSERAAAIGLQQGTHLSKNGLSLLILEDRSKGPLDHVCQAMELDHPFQMPVALPLDLQFAAERGAEDPHGANAARWKKWKRLEELAERAKPLDEEIRSRMADSVKIAAASLQLGLLTVLTFIARWPDWQLSSLFTRGF